MLSTFLNSILILWLIGLFIVGINKKYIISGKEYVPIFNISLIQNNNLYNKLKVWSLYISIITLILFIYIYSNISYNNIYISEIDKILDIPIGIDSISLYFILLLLILYPILILSSWYNNFNTPYLYYILVLIIPILLLLNFLCIDLYYFYIFFEATLIPLYILITIYGSNNRKQAAYYILMYTLLGSLCMLISLCWTNAIIDDSTFFLIYKYIPSLDIQFILWILLFIAIMVKSPILPLHTWLPLVHSESPLAGSILLAGIVLKLTVYLIIRWILPFLPEISLLFTPFVFTICLLTIILISFITMIQNDLKVIVAYSSVSHMSVCILGIFSNSLAGIEGSYLLGLAHGLVSPALFIAVGGILYDRFHTRIIYYYNGLLSIMPYFSFYLIIISFANIGTPLSLNFIGEFLSLFGAFNNNFILGIICISSIFLSATYQMKITNKITGGINSYIFTNNDITKVESISLNVLIIITLILGIFPSYITQHLDLLFNSYVIYHIG
uniref:NADH-ubiquinone oxidoreductase chain 4 n=1 Tax=Groenewaldozyma salmanticensis TaxID=49332 RepID=E5L084_9ASCO|nr:NADH dehydrogenase subunit 4 [Groenewaldozyma salmanticensis]ADO51049.1 NADH dehydrogenase subunit 4 [Groenewaldozyma salmanticensis]